MPSSRYKNLGGVGSTINTVTQTLPRFQKPLSEKEVETLIGGDPTSLSPLNLNTINLTAITGLKKRDRSATLGQTAPYGEFIKSEAETIDMKKSTVLRDNDAQLFRTAIYLASKAINYQGQQILKLASTEELTQMAADKQAAAKESLQDLGQEFKQWSRSIVGTCPELNSSITKLPWGLRQIVFFFLNDFFRSFGNLFWCCNPWSGICFLVAILVSDGPMSQNFFQASVAAEAVVVGTLTGNALGASKGMMQLGLLQFACILASQYVAYHHVRSPPFAESASLGAFGVVAVCSVLTSLFGLLVNPIVIKVTGIIPFSMPHGLGMILTMGVGFSTNEYLSLKNDYSYPPHLYAQEQRVGKAWAYDWSEILRVMFTGIGSCVWAQGYASAVLCWVGIFICSPVLALLACIGSITGTLAMQMFDIPTEEIYSGYNHWEPIIACQVIGGLMFNISTPSVVFGGLAAALNVVFSIAGRVWLAPLGLPAGAISHGLTCFLCCCIRYHKSFMAPVELAKMTVPEDHLYQRLMSTKLFTDLEDAVFTAAKEAGKEKKPKKEKSLSINAALNSTLQMTGLDQTLDHHAKELRVHSWAFMLKNWWFTLISFGAYNAYIFESVNRSKLTENEIADVYCPGGLIQSILRAYNKIHASYGQFEEKAREAATDEARLKAYLLAYFLMNRQCEATADDLDAFYHNFTEAHNSIEEMGISVTYETKFVCCVVHAKMIATMKQELQSYYNFLDADGSGSVSPEELISGMMMLNLDDNGEHFTMVISYLDHYLQTVDKNNDRSLSLDEICYVFTPPGLRQAVLRICCDRTAEIKGPQAKKAWQTKNEGGGS
jgi:urea transporter